MTNILNKQVIIIVGIFLAILAGLFFVIAKPRFKTFKERYKALSESETKLASLTARKESLIILKKDEKRIEEALKRVLGILPEKKETSDFLVQLEAGARDTGNNLKSINMTENPKQEAPKKEEEEAASKEKTQKEPSKTAQPSSYQTIIFSITIEGNFKQFLDFITLTESLSRFAVFPSLIINTTQGNLIQTKLEGEIYYKGVK